MPRHITVKIPNMKLHEKLPVGIILIHAQGRMDGHEKVRTHTQFAKASENDMWSLKINQNEYKIVNKFVEILKALEASDSFL
jgi:hypothetical protein